MPKKIRVSEGAKLCFEESSYCYTIHEIFRPCNCRIKRVAYLIFKGVVSALHKVILIDFFRKGGSYAYG